MTTPEKKETEVYTVIKHTLTDIYNQLQKRSRQSPLLLVIGSTGRRLTWQRFGFNFPPRTSESIFRSDLNFVDIDFGVTTPKRSDPQILWNILREISKQKSNATLVLDPHLVEVDKTTEHFFLRSRMFDIVIPFLPIHVVPSIDIISLDPSAHLIYLLSSPRIRPKDWSEIIRALQVLYHLKEQAIIFPTYPLVKTFILEHIKNVSNLSYDIAKLVYHSVLPHKLRSRLKLTERVKSTKLPLLFGFESEKPIWM